MPGINEQLRKAVKKGTVDDVRAILDAPADPSDPIDKKTNLIAVALRRAEYYDPDDIDLKAERKNGGEIARLLIEHDFDVNHLDGGMPLHTAAYYGYVDVVDALLKKGAKVDSFNSQGGTPLAKVCQGNKSNGGLRNPHAADLAIAELLLTHGANANLSRVDPLKSPILLALTSSGFKPVFKSLLPHVADLRPLKEFLDKNNSGGLYNWAEELVQKEEQTANRKLRKAVTDGDIKTVQKLLEENPDPDDPINITEGENLICVAMSECAKDASQYDEASLRKKQSGGAIARLLIEHGCDVNRQRDGQSPLHVAAYYGYLDVVDSLLKNGAEVDRLNSEGETPLAQVCKKNESNPKEDYPLDVSHQRTFHDKNSWIALLLLDHGANPNLSGPDSNATPIVLAADTKGYEEMFELLLSRTENLQPLKDVLNEYNQRNNSDRYDWALQLIQEEEQKRAEQQSIRPDQQR